MCGQRLCYFSCVEGGRRLQLPAGEGISSRAPNRPSPGDFAAPAPKKGPSRAPRSPFFAGSGQNWCRRTQAEPGALGGAWGAGASEKGACARPGSDPRVFSRRFLTLFPRISPARSPSSGRPRRRNASPKHGKSSASTRPPAWTRAWTRTGTASRPRTSKASTCSAAPRRWRTIGAYPVGVQQMAWNRRGGRGSPGERRQHWGSGTHAVRPLIFVPYARRTPTVCLSAQLLRMFAMYRGDNQDADFKHLHVYKRIDKCEKWAEVRRTLDKAKETYKPDATTPGASEGRPDGHKLAKKGESADAATTRVQESIEHCLADAQARAVLREEKTEARWSSLMKNNAIKPDLLRTNVAAKKRNTDMAFLLSGADMLQSNDEKLKAWYLVQRDLILNELPTATPMTPTTTRTPSPNGASTSPPSSAEAAPTQPCDEAGPTPTSPRTPTPPTPGADQAEWIVAHGGPLFFVTPDYVRSPDLRRLLRAGMTKFEFPASWGRRVGAWLGAKSPPGAELAPARPQAALFRRPGGPNGWRCPDGRAVLVGWWHATCSCAGEGSASAQLCVLL